MLKLLRNLTLCMTVGVTFICVAPLLAQAQQTNEDQRAYQAGYQHGVNDAQRNRAMNMNSDDWHGDRLNIYQRGYREGYDSVKGYGHDHDARGHDDAYRMSGSQYQGEDQKAFQAGFQRGVNDARAHRGMNMNTDDWHGDRVNIYQRGYHEGFESVENDRH